MKTNCYYSCICAYLSNVSPQTANARKDSLSMKCIFPTMTIECNGPPNSISFNSPNVPTTIFSSTAPTRASPTAIELIVQMPSFRLDSISSSCDTAVLTVMNRDGSYILRFRAMFSIDCSLTFMSRRQRVCRPYKLLILILS